MADEEENDLNKIGKIESRDINDEMQESYLDYAMSVIVARALPDVRDGMKPVHRRILYAMDKLGVRSTARYKKSANIVGEVLGKYHPHGDTAVYETMVRMAQEWTFRYMLVDGQGNFGSMDGDSAAAYRYTEAKMTKVSEEMLADIDRGTVDFVPNYDGSLKEPQVLPAKLPNLLLNGQIGIAVGMATAIPPHNLGELVDAIGELIDNPDTAIEDLIQHIKGPDFPTGGIIYNADDIKTAYATGRGKIVIRAKAEIEEKKRGFRIVVTEVPYQVNKAAMIEKIANLVKEKKIAGISDLRDESDRKGVRVVVELKKDAHPNKILNQLFKMTQMQHAFHVNMIALVDGIQPRVLTLKNILEEFIKHRFQVVTRRTEFELAKAKARAHILEGLLIALKRIDAVIETIKKSKDKEVAKVNLMKKFKLTEIQAQAILDMRLQTLAGLERQKIKDEYDALQKLIKELEDLLAHPKKIYGVIKGELAEMKEKYGDERRTKVVKTGIGEFSDKDLIPNDEVIVTMTKGNYIKRIPVSTYRVQHRGGKGVVGMKTKEEDLVTHMVFTQNHDNILFFTNKGRVFQTLVYELPEASRIAKGHPIVNVLQLAPEEVVTAIINVSGKKESKYLMMVTKKGTIKKTPLDSFLNIRKTGIIAIGLDKSDELKWVKMTDGDSDIIMATKNSLAIRFNEKDVRPMGRAARGVRGIKLKGDDEVVGMDPIIAGGELLVVMENGYGKRTKLGQFTPHRRGGMGIKAGVVTKKWGRTVDVRVIASDEDDLVVVSRKGVIIRTPLVKISKIGRATQGVRIMRIDADDRVASVACIAEKENGDKDKQQQIPLEEVQSKKEKVKKEVVAKKPVAKKQVQKVTKKSAQKSKPNIKKPKKTAKPAKKKAVKKTAKPKPVFRKTKVKPAAKKSKAKAPGFKKTKVRQKKK
jgi:DNA gyrase subunit A